jgi:hypothetical protein
MQDRPTAVELIAAARQYLESDIIPALTDARLRFQTLVAANVLSIVERELQSEESDLAIEWTYLAKRLGLGGRRLERLADLRQAVREANAKLCTGIRAGEFDQRDRFLEIVNETKRSVERKLEIANPRYLTGFYDNYV